MEIATDDNQNWTVANEGRVTRHLCNGGQVRAARCRAGSGVRMPFTQIVAPLTPSPLQYLGEPYLATHEPSPTCTRVWRLVTRGFYSGDRQIL